MKYLVDSSWIEIRASKTCKLAGNSRAALGVSNLTAVGLPLFGSGFLVAFSTYALTEQLNECKFGRDDGKISITWVKSPDRSPRQRKTVKEGGMQATNPSDSASLVSNSNRFMFSRLWSEKSAKW
jgi:hypothetical protein